MTKTSKTKQLALMGLLSALLLLMAYTPLGYLNVGPLAITFNVIPVAIAAVSMGAVGGAVIGGVFGFTSFLQCFGLSKLGTALFAVSPALTFVQCFVPRILDGLLIGLIAAALKKSSVNVTVTGLIVGFCAAFFNTLLYMSSLVLLFRNSETIQTYKQSIAPDGNWFVFVVLFVGINAVAEMISSTVITGGVCTALAKAKLIVFPKKAEQQ